MLYRATRSRQVAYNTRRYVSVVCLIVQTTLTANTGDRLDVIKDKTNNTNVSANWIKHPLVQDY